MTKPLSNLNVSLNESRLLEEEGIMQCYQHGFTGLSALSTTALAVNTICLTLLPQYGALTAAAFVSIGTLGIALGAAFMVLVCLNQRSELSGQLLKTHILSLTQLSLGRISLRQHLAEYVGETQKLIEDRLPTNCCDITLKVGTYTLRCHKAILAHESSMFANLLADCPETKELELDRFPPAVMIPIVRSFYGEKLDLLPDAESIDLIHPALDYLGARPKNFNRDWVIKKGLSPQWEIEAELIQNPLVIKDRNPYRSSNLSTIYYQTNVEADIKIMVGKEKLDSHKGLIASASSLLWLKVSNQEDIELPKAIKPFFYWAAFGNFESLTFEEADDLLSNLDLLFDLQENGPTIKGMDPDPVLADNLVHQIEDYFWPLLSHKNAAFALQLADKHGLSHLFRRRCIEVISQAVVGDMPILGPLESVEELDLRTRAFSPPYINRMSAQFPSLKILKLPATPHNELDWLAALIKRHPTTAIHTDLQEPFLAKLLDERNARIEQRTPDTPRQAGLALNQVLLNQTLIPK